MNGFVANGAFSPSLIRQSQIMQNAGPAKNMAAPCQFGSFGRIQTDRTIRHNIGRFQNDLLNQIPIDQNIGIDQVNRIISRSLDHKFAIGLQILLLKIEKSKLEKQIRNQAL